MKAKLNFIFTTLVSVVFFSALVLSGCKKTEDTLPPPVIDYCTDGIQNNGETGVDCGGTCDPCADAFNYTLPFYIQFRENSGSFVYFQDDDPQHSIRTTAGVTLAETYFSPAFNVTHGFAIRFTGKLEDLAGKSLSFDFNELPSAKMIFFDSNGDEYRTSENWSDQSKSNCYIESVTLVDSEQYSSFTVYRYAAKGNFNCKVSDSNGTSNGILAYGKFSIMLIKID